MDHCTPFHFDAGVTVLRYFVARVPFPPVGDDIKRGRALLQVLFSVKTLRPPPLFLQWVWSPSVRMTNPVK